MPRSLIKKLWQLQILINEMREPNSSTSVNYDQRFSKLRQLSWLEDHQSSTPTPDLKQIKQRRFYFKKMPTTIKKNWELQANFSMSKESSS